MKRLVLLTGLLVGLCPTAQAATKTLKSAAADAFIAKHFPDADIPGPVAGPFRNAAGVPHKGHAKCDVPAMGGRSEGAVSTCTLRY